MRFWSKHLEIRW